MEELADLSKKWKHWHYKNTFLLLTSLILFFLFTGSPIVKNMISFLGDLGYPGAFISGAFFVSIFTVAPAAAVLFFIAERLNPLLVAVFAGAGAVIGDYVIFRFLKDRVFEELKPLYLQSGGNIIKKLFQTPYFAWMIPLAGILIIASPLPDEIGVGLLGLSKLKSWQFVCVAFLLNALGIFAVLMAARLT